jgi:hypothetical protein
MEARLAARINDNSARVLNRLASLEQGFQNTRTFLVGDALVCSRRRPDLEARVAKLETKNG